MRNACRCGGGEGEVAAELLADFALDGFDDHAVDVIAAEVRVARGGEHLVDAAFVGLLQAEDRDIERAAS